MHVFCGQWKTDKGLHINYNNVGFISNGSEDIMTESTENRRFSKVSEEIASENTENCRCRQPHCRLTTPPAPLGNSANILTDLKTPETRVIGLHFCR